MMKLTFDKARWFEDGDGFWLALRTKDRSAAAQASAQVGKPWTADLKVVKKGRSLDANAYAWVLLDKLAVALRTPKEDVYRRFIREIGGNCETVCVVDEAVDKLRRGWEHNGTGWVTDTMPSKIQGCTNVTLYYGSSTYDTAQMSRFISMIVDECRGFDIETLTPEKLAAMQEGWK